MRKILMGLAVAGLVLAGCAKPEEEVEPMPDTEAAAPAEPTMPSMTPEEHAKMGEMGDHTAAEGADKADVCPVEGGKITSKAVYADHNGTRYYFCCADCPKPFLENPDNYISEHPEWAAKWSEQVPS